MSAGFEPTTCLQSEASSAIELRTLGEELRILLAPEPELNRFRRGAEPLFSPGGTPSDCLGPGAMRLVH